MLCEMFECITDLKSDNAIIGKITLTDVVLSLLNKNFGENCVIVKK